MSENFALFNSPELTYSIGDTVKVYNGHIGVVLRRYKESRSKATMIELRLTDGTIYTCPEHYIKKVWRN